MRRIRYGEWFIQSEKAKDGRRYLAWASKERITSPLDPVAGDVYFDYGKTEIEAIDKVKAEVDALNR